MIGWDKKPEIGQYFQGRLCDKKGLLCSKLCKLCNVSSSILSLVCHLDSDQEHFSMAVGTFIVRQSRKSARGDLYLPRYTSA